MEPSQEKKVIEDIADTIEKLADSVNDLLKGRLNKKALLILLAASSGMSRGTVEQVLEALKNLKTDYLSK